MSPLFEKATAVAARLPCNLYFDPPMLSIRKASTATEAMRSRVVYILVSYLTAIAATIPLPDRKATWQPHMNPSADPLGPLHHCCKRCSPPDCTAAKVRPTPRRGFPSPPGVLRTGTTSAEAVTPTVGSLDIVMRTLSTGEGEERDLVEPDVSIQIGLWYSH